MTEKYKMHDCEDARLCFSGAVVKASAYHAPEIVRSILSSSLCLPKVQCGFLPHKKS
jgi:hypothetical protein